MSDKNNETVDSVTTEESLNSQTQGGCCGSTDSKEDESSACCRKEGEECCGEHGDTCCGENKEEDCCNDDAQCCGGSNSGCCDDLQEDEQADSGCCGGGKCGSQETEKAPELVLKTQYDELHNKYIRLYSEFENFRNRTQREKADLIETANANLLEKMCEVKENFDRAFHPDNKAADAEAFEKGMKLIREHFDKVLKDSGLEIMDPSGEEFDPNIHEAFMQQSSDSIAENHVITVFQKGYKIKNKIIRTAKVIVSSGKEV
jgi:molecular chaperone GrpE